MTIPEYVPGLAGVPAARSAISFIDGEEGILEYRGIRIEELALNSTYEEVAYLLFYGKLPTTRELADFARKLADARPIPAELTALIKSFPATAHPMDALQTAISAMGMFHPDVDYGESTVRETRALEITAQMPTIVGAIQRAREGKEPLEPDATLNEAADFLRMMTGEVPDELSTRVMDVSLILHADHTMNASTFTARVTGSTMASPYSVVAAAVGSLSGPLHGGANEQVLFLLREIGDKKRVRDIISDMITRKQKIMGLGHRVYKTKDPRATILQQLTTELFRSKGRSDVYDIAVELEEVAREMLADKDIYPNVDFYSGIVYDKMGIPTDMFTPIFAVSRVAGWLAHWLEQMQDNRIFRPRQIYEGLRQVPYVPIDDR